MLGSLKNIFRVAELRNKVLFTLLIIAIYQLGANVPIPGTSFAAVQQLEQAAKQGGVFSFLNLFSGNALSRAAVFGLGIMPYITSSIIIQLLTTVIPKLDEWREQGAAGQRKITQTTRYLTVTLALLQSTGLVFVFHKGGAGLLPNNQKINLIPNFTLPRVLFIVMTFTAGTAFVMWLGEMVTQRGIGQGMSILIFTNVVAGLPTGGHIIFIEAGKLKFTVIVLLSLALIVSIIVVELGQRRIPVIFPRRVIGRQMYGGDQTYIPLKVNQAGLKPYGHSPARRGTSHSEGAPQPSPQAQSHLP